MHQSFCTPSSLFLRCLPFLGRLPFETPAVTETPVAVTATATTATGKKLALSSSSMSLGSTASNSLTQSHFTQKSALWGKKGWVTDYLNLVKRL